MIHLIDGRVIPGSQVDCINMNSLPPLSEIGGNCKNCAMKQFALTRTSRPVHLNYKPIEIVYIEKCPWFLMMEERDIAISKNESLGQTISDAVDEIDLLKDILQRNKKYYSVER